MKQKSNLTEFRVPDITDLTKRAGLPDRVTPFELDEHEGELHIAKDGNNTGTVRAFLPEAFAKVIRPARAFAAAHKNATPKQLGEKFSGIKFLGEPWIEKTIKDQCLSKNDLQAGEQAAAVLEEKLPILRQFPVEVPKHARTQMIEELRKDEFGSCSVALACVILSVRDKDGEKPLSTKTIQRYLEKGKLRRAHTTDAITNKSILALLPSE